MSISIPIIVPKDMVSEIVADVEAICNDGLCKLCDETEVEGAISSTMSDAV